MANSSVKNVILPVVIVVIGFAAIVGLSNLITSIRPSLPAEFSDSDLSMNGSRFKGFALGMEGLLADWYWMRSLQYIGNKMVLHQNADVDLGDLRSLNPRLLYPLLSNTTDLDPHFIAAYSYGAIVLPAIDQEKAIDFARKGIADNPDEWRLYQHLGFIYWRLQRYDDAAQTYERGASISGASSFMTLMAATMRSEGGSRATARAIYKQMLAESTDEAVRITAERRLMQLDSLDQREAIDQALSEYKERTGRCANNWSELASSLLRTRLPNGREFRVDLSHRVVDPTGAPYLIDKEDCRVKLDREHTGLPVN